MVTLIGDNVNFAFASVENTHVYILFRNFRGLIDFNLSDGPEFRCILCFFSKLIGSKVI